MKTPAHLIAMTRRAGLARQLFVILAGLSFGGAVAIAQENARPGVTQRHLLSQAAGHRALYTCTGLWSAGLTPEMIERDGMEKRGPLPEAMAAVKGSVIIDEAARSVAVSFADDAPPRIAAWRPHIGCTQLATGADPASLKHLPRLPADFKAPALDHEPWPRGDRNAMARLRTGQARQLERIMDEALEGNVYGGITWAALVIKDGKIVGERYGLGYDMHKLQRTHSAAKSIAATLVGISVHEGLLKLDSPAPIPEWRANGDPRARITLNDLLHMSSGLYTERAGNPQDELYMSGALVAERSAGNVVDSMPGKRWVYAGSDTLLAVRALRAALGDDARYLAFPFTELFWKIGMTRTVPETDWNGDYLLSGQVYSSARDLARLALLYMSDGVWNGERILPEGWAKYVSTPSPAQPANSWVGADCAKAKCGRAYGAQFWLPAPGAGIPAGTYTPVGARGQYALIIPSRNVIIVRRGLDREGEPQFDLSRFAADVLAALDHD